jgi:hypothetical protein
LSDISLPQTINIGSPRESAYAVWDPLQHCISKSASKCDKPSSISLQLQNLMGQDLPEHFKAFPDNYRVREENYYANSWDCVFFKRNNIVSDHNKHNEVNTKNYWAK